MKKFLYVALGLFLLLVLVVLVISSMQVTGPVIEQPAAEVTPPPVIKADTAIEAVSPSSAYSRRLHGVFMKSVICTPTQLRLGDSIDVEITDAWLERQWEPKSGGLFGEPDFRRGYAQDSAIDTPRSQLVLAFAPTSRLGHFDEGSWRINLSTDTYKEHGFDRSRGNQLVMYFNSSNAVFPMKFSLYTDPKPCPDCQPRARASFTISE